MDNADCAGLNDQANTDDAGVDNDAGADDAGTEPGNDVTYTCYVPMGGGAGMCRIECINASDTTSCPDGLTCQDVSMNGGVWRCSY